MKTITVREILTMRCELEGESAYDLISDETVGCDEEDGGAEYDYVVQEKSTLQYFAFNCNDWDISTRYVGESDYDNEIQMTEVTRKERVEVYFEKT